MHLAQRKPGEATRGESRREIMVLGELTSHATHAPGDVLDAVANGDVSVRRSVTIGTSASGRPAGPRVRLSSHDFLENKIQSLSMKRLAQKYAIISTQVNHQIIQSSFAVTALDYLF